MKNTKTAVLGGVAMLAGMAGASAQQAPALYSVRGVDIRPHVAYTFMYDDNIFLEHKDKTPGGKGNAGRDHDFIHVITPGLRLNAGDAAARQAAYFDANYEAAITRFTDYTGSDALDHNANVQLGGKFNRLSLSLEQSLVSASDADQKTLAAANGRVKRKTWGTRADVGYEISDKTSTSLELRQTIGDYNAPLVDSTDRSAHVFVDYQVLPKVKMGVGGGVGYLQVDGNAATHNANSSYYDGQVRIDWQATEKVSIKAHGGIEFRNIQEVGAKDPVNFIFGLAGSWKASEKTMISLAAERGVQAANANVGVYNEETSVTLGIKQVLAENVTLSLDAGYAYDHYKATQGGALAPGALRDDNYFFLKPGIAYRFAERAQAMVFYQYRRNDSTVVANGNDFYNNQLGVELSYRF